VGWRDLVVPADCSAAFLVVVPFLAVPFLACPEEVYSWEVHDLVGSQVVAWVVHLAVVPLVELRGVLGVDHGVVLWVAFLVARQVVPEAACQAFPSA